MESTLFEFKLKKQGLIKGSRHHVHLSADEETAKAVGMRHGMPVILSVSASAMPALVFIALKMGFG